MHFRFGRAGDVSSRIIHLLCDIVVFARAAGFPLLAGLFVFRSLLSGPVPLSVQLCGAFPVQVVKLL